MRRQKEDSIKSREKMDNIVRDMQEVIEKRGSKAIIEESISLDDFNNHVQQLLQER